MKNVLFFAVATFWYAFSTASPAPAGDRSSDNLNLDIHSGKCGDAPQGSRFHLPAENISVIPGSADPSEYVLRGDQGMPGNWVTQSPVIDLGAVRSISRVIVHFPPGVERKDALGVEIYGDDDRWTRVLSDVHFESSSTAAVELCFPTMNARYVRIRGKHDSVHWVEEKYAGVEVWGYPVPDVTWIYDSGPALAADITMQRNAAHPQDPVLFSSGASGVQSHSVVDGWLQIESGRGNGRVYWNYHEVPEFELLQNAGYNMAMTGTFRLTPGIRNLSIKDGNHGTDGWILDDSLAFGGFGLSIWRTHVQSKAEYWHNEQGSSHRSDYPNGLELVDNTEYRYFMTVRTRPRTEEVLLNVWLDFGSNGWIHVMQNRTWGEAGWSPGGVPDRSDKTAIVRGPYHIRRHHLWTRANGSGFLPVKDIRIGVLEPHP